MSAGHGVGTRTTGCHCCSSRQCRRAGSGTARTHDRLSVCGHRPGDRCRHRNLDLILNVSGVHTGQVRRTQNTASSGSSIRSVRCWRAWALVDNAAVRGGSLLDVELRVWHGVFDVDCAGCPLCTWAFGRRMRESRGIDRPRRLDRLSVARTGGRPVCSIRSVPGTCTVRHPSIVTQYSECLGSYAG